jgi:hypothetical protein
LSQLQKATQKTLKTRYLLSRTLLKNKNKNKEEERKRKEKKKRSYLLSSLSRQFLLLLSTLSGRRGMLYSLEMRARIKLRLWKGSIGVLKSCLPTSGKCREISKYMIPEISASPKSIFSTLFLLVSCLFCFFASLSLHLTVYALSQLFLFSVVSPHSFAVFSLHGNAFTYPKAKGKQCIQS